MNKNTLFACLILLTSLSAFGQQQQQQRRQGRPAVLVEVSTQSVYKEIFPEGTELRKANDYWFKIVNSKGKTVGYALNSTEYCKDVKGYANATPVMIVTDKKFVIKKVAMLSNYESPNFVQRLNASGFFKNWSDKKIKEAKKDKVDGYTGATFTANAIVKNVNFLLENGGKKLPK